MYEYANESGTSQAQVNILGACSGSFDDNGFYEEEIAHAEVGLWRMSRNWCWSSFPFNSEEATSLSKSTDVSIEDRNVAMRSIGSFITSTERWNPQRLEKQLRRELNQFFFYFLNLRVCDL